MVEIATAPTRVDARVEGFAMTFLFEYQNVIVDRLIAVDHDDFTSRIFRGQGIDHLAGILSGGFFPRQNQQDIIIPRVQLVAQGDHRVLGGGFVHIDVVADKADVIVLDDLDSAAGDIHP